MELLFAYFIIFAAISGALASDPDPLQDLCVADLASGVRVNGFACKDVANITAADFSFDGLAKAGVPNNSFGAVATAATVNEFPGLNTLGLSLARADFAPGGLVPPHTHPRATEVVFLLEGVLDVSFITTSNVLFSKTVKKGEVFVFPRGLIHFLKNNSDKPAAAVAIFNGQSPGNQVTAPALFAATPEVPDNVLAIAFQIGTEEVHKIKSVFATNKQNLHWMFGIFWKMTCNLSFIDKFV